MQASVVVTTYNWPEALNLVLQSLSNQSIKDFEVIVADDGSKAPTKHIIESFKQSLNLKHIWQEDHGFRAARARNLAVQAASSDYIIFIDGDCVVPKHFVQSHLALKVPKMFTVGNRILLSKSFTENLLASGTFPSWSLWQWHYAALQGKINRALSLWQLPLGSLRRLAPKRWKGAKTCHLAANKQDLLAVCGFDETFEGWGYEDSDLVVRLINHGVFRQTSKFKTTVWHLWHNESPRANASQNYQKVLARIANGQVLPEQGL